MDVLIETGKHALMVTGFVAVMMLIIEYLNVISMGAWQERLSRRRWGQYFLAAFLGATPGCLGAFAVVAMYSHKRMSLGAIVAAMIATAGDESFVMFAMIPRTALVLHAILLLVGLLAGFLTDLALGRRFSDKLSCETDFSVHEEAHCECFSLAMIRTQWKKCSAARGTLSMLLAFILLAVATGQLGPGQWDWERVSLVIVSLVALFIVVTVPDHFLEDHLWRHVVRGHVPRVFLWTLGALLFLHLIVERLDVSELIRRSQWVVMAVAGLVGVIPESGPHLFFVTLFDKGIVPFSVLLASSIVQDGHGMLPLLAHSRRAFLVVKLINLLVGLVVGALVMALGT